MDTVNEAAVNEADRKRLEREIAERWRLNAIRTGPATPRERRDAEQAVLRMMAKPRPALQHEGYTDVVLGWTHSPLEAVLLGGLLAARHELKKPFHVKPESDGFYPLLRDLWGQDLAAPADTQSYWYSGNMKAAIHETGGGTEEATSLVKACLRDSWRLVNGGNQWDAWSAFTQFERDVVGTKADWSDIEDYWMAARCAGPRFMHPKFVILSDFPTKLSLDEDGQVHADSGGFAEWSDSVKMYAHHGRPIPRWIGERNFTVERLKSENNAEYRRIAIEKYGWSRYLVESGAKIVDMDSLTLEGSAPRVLMKDDRGDKILIGTDGSTKRVYSMRVPREAATCRQAHEMIAGFPESELAGEC